MTLYEQPCISDRFAIMNAGRTEFLRSTVVSDFKKVSAKNAVWVETVQGFEQAKKRLLHYTSSSSDEYLVFDANEGQFIDVLGKAESA